MSAFLLNGTQCSEKLRNSVAEQVKLRKEQTGKDVKLCVVQVGDNPSGLSYLKNNVKIFRELGILTEVVELGDLTTTEELKATLQRLNDDEQVNGILLQMPLPKGIDRTEAQKTIAPWKDVDGVNPISVGNLFLGDKDAFVPNTPGGVMELLKFYGISVQGKHVVVLGRSNIVGKPLAVLMTQENATVTLCHSKTENLSEITKTADILVSAVGKAEWVTADMVRPGAVVVDVGINFKSGKLCGDVAFEEVSEVAGSLTPTPGGTGPMTVTMLAMNTLKAFDLQQNNKK